MEAYSKLPIVEGLKKEIDADLKIMKSTKMFCGDILHLEC
jgi:hypothetical protein